MRHKFKVLLMVFGFSQLFSCGQSNQLSDWLGNDQKLSEQDSTNMSKWLLGNGFKPVDFKVVKHPKSHSSEFSVQRRVECEHSRDFLG